MSDCAAATVSAAIWHTWESALIAVCWALWAAVWLAGALYNAGHAPAVRRRALPRGFWFAGLLVVWLVLRALPGGQWRSLTVSALWLRALGAVLLVCATAFTLWARVALGAMWSSAVVIREAHVLRTGGPYAVTRHPIYTGMLGMLLGSVVLGGLGRWTALFLLGLVIVITKVRAEERLLGETFGAEYERYRKRVPALVPGPRSLEALRRR